MYLDQDYDLGLCLITSTNEADLAQCKHFEDMLNQWSSTGFVQYMYKNLDLILILAGFDLNPAKRR